jgi:hypothetical protein
VIRLARRDLSPIQLGVVVCTVVAAVLALVYLPQAIDEFQDGATANSALGFDDREFAGGNGLVVDKAALYEARGLIPEDESYRVVTGSKLSGATDLTLPYIESFARYFLLPRRPDPAARWVVCYGCDTAQLGAPLDVLWRDANGILVGRLRT